MKKIDIAIIGATGIVGQQLLELLAERRFPVGHLYLLASERSIGEEIFFRKKSYQVESLANFDFTKSKLVFCCAANDIAAEFVPLAAAAGNIVIDKSAYFRHDPAVPLVIPEVNGALLQHLPKKIIASPNCSTIPIVMALKPLHDAVGIARVNIATYQSVSGSGKGGVQELAEQTQQLLAGKPITPKVYARQIAFNLLPQIDVVEQNGYTREEMKVVEETKKILADETIAINPTAVRVPVFYGHAAAVHVETRKKLTLAEAMTLFTHSPNLHVLSTESDFPPTPTDDAAGKDDVFIGRIREDISHPQGIDFWVVTDNIRKGAALNAVHIAEELIKLRMIG